MLNISNFFQKFVNIRKDSAIRLSMIAQAIKSETGIDFSIDKLEMKGDKLKIDCNPVFRNEIFMHKEGIERILRSEKIFVDII